MGKNVMRYLLVLVFVIVTFFASFFVIIPDYFTKMTYGLISAALCAVLIWVSLKILSIHVKGYRSLSLICFFFTILTSFGAHLIAYLMSTR